MLEQKSIVSSQSAMSSFTLSRSACLVLELLGKRTAYNVRGQWRIRGRRRAIESLTLSCLLGSGLAERVVMGQWLQLRLTRAGRAVLSARNPAARGSERQKAGVVKNIRGGPARSGWPESYGAAPSVDTVIASARRGETGARLRQPREHARANQAGGV